MAEGLTKVYVALCADPLHYAHMNIINQAKKHGQVILGLLTDKAICEYKSPPLMTYEQRFEVVKNLSNILMVVPQDSLDYTENLRKYHPAYVVHSDQWKTGVQSETRRKVLEVLSEWGGNIIEIPHTEGISSTMLRDHFRKSEPYNRQPVLNSLLKLKPLVRVIEAHSGLSAIIAENTKVSNRQFDALWISSFTDSASKGKPDIELVDFTSRLQTINEVLEATTKPLIVDGDTGGAFEHFAYMVRTLDRLGVSAVVIEDKKFPKQNSLKKVKHDLEDPDVFARKIRIGNDSKRSSDFLIFARIESLTCGQSVIDAMKRADVYVKAGASGIVIHSHGEKGTRVMNFCSTFRTKHPKIPLVIIPTTYPCPDEHFMKTREINMVIYANQLLRSSYLAMCRTANSVLIGSDPDMVGVDEILEATGN